MEELADDKKNLILLQEELVKQEICHAAELHKIKFNNMNKLHELKMYKLKLKCDLLEKKIKNKQ